MRPTLLLVALTALITLAGCGSGSPPAVSDSVQKIEGPDVKTLSHDDLMAVLDECYKYGPATDPKVKYTARYCSAAQSAHGMEGFTTPSTTPVDPTITKVH